MSLEFVNIMMNWDYWNGTLVQYLKRSHQAAVGHSLLTSQQLPVTQNHNEIDDVLKY